jgi:hypothetical protein
MYKCTHTLDDYIGVSLGHVDLTREHGSNKTRAQIFDECHKEISGDLEYHASIGHMCLNIYHFIMYVALISS